MTTIEELFALSKEPPLRSVVIGDKVFALGDLSPGALADITAWGNRLVAHASGAPLEPGDDDPTRILQHLIFAADNDFEMTKELRKHVTPEVIVAAGREMMRQVTVRALAAHDGSA
ncbi:MAG: hypothetical protein WDM86_22290 [Rhizomicrobium sp.]